MTLDAVNLGNTQINTKIAVETPSDWIHQVTGRRSSHCLPASQDQSGLPPWEIPGPARLTHKEGHPSRGQPSRYHSKYAPSTPGPTSHPIGGWVGGCGNRARHCNHPIEKGTGIWNRGPLRRGDTMLPLRHACCRWGSARLRGVCARFHSPGQSKACDPHRWSHARAGRPGNSS